MSVQEYTEEEKRVGLIVAKLMRETARYQNQLYWQGVMMGLAAGMTFAAFVLVLATRGFLP